MLQKHVDISDGCLGNFLIGSCGDGMRIRNLQEYTALYSRHFLCIANLHARPAQANRGSSVTIVQDVHMLLQRNSSLSHRQWGVEQVPR